MKETKEEISFLVMITWSLYKWLKLQGMFPKVVCFTSVVMLTSYSWTRHYVCIRLNAVEGNKISIKNTKFISIKKKRCRSFFSITFYSTGFLPYYLQITAWNLDGHTWRNCLFLSELAKISDSTISQIVFKLANWYQSQKYGPIYHK